MLNESDVRAIADQVLSLTLGPFGFERADVKAGPDHYDEDSLFVTAHFKHGSDVTSGKAAGNAMVALSEALEEKGERRFPYLSFDYPDEEATHEEEAESVGS